MTTAAAPAPARPDRAEAEFDRFDLLIRYQARRAVALAAAALIAALIVAEAIARQGVFESVPPVTTQIIGGAAALLGLWVWMTGESRRFRLRLLRAEIHDLATKPLSPKKGDPAQSALAAE